MEEKSIAYRISLWVIVTVVSLVILIPLLWIFVSSITPASELFQSPIQYIPANPTLDNYSRLITSLNIGTKAVNTLIITLFSILISTVVCTLAAYAFNRYKSRGLSIALAALLGSTLIPAIVAARPLYDFMRAVKLIDTFPGLIILYTSALIPFSVLILTNFFGEIPVTIEEAADVDGANFYQKFFMISLPLMRPAIATICIINFITCLNDLLTPLFFANRIEVLSVAITTIPRQNAYSVPWDLTSAMGWIILLPIIIFVLIFQKHIMDGIMAGGVKG